MFANVCMMIASHITTSIPNLGFMQVSHVRNHLGITASDGNNVTTPPGAPCKARVSGGLGTFDAICRKNIYIYNIDLKCIYIYIYLFTYIYICMSKYIFKERISVNLHWPLKHTSFTGEQHVLHWFPRHTWTITIDFCIVSIQGLSQMIVMFHRIEKHYNHSNLNCKSVKLLRSTHELETKSTQLSF